MREQKGKLEKQREGMRASHERKEARREEKEEVAPCITSHSSQKAQWVWGSLTPYLRGLDCAVPACRRSSMSSWAIFLSSGSHMPSGETWLLVNHTHSCSPGSRNPRLLFFFFLFFFFFSGHRQSKDISVTRAHSNQLMRAERKEYKNRVIFLRLWPFV